MNARPTTDVRICPFCSRPNPEDRMTCWRCGNWMDAPIDDDDEEADELSGLSSEGSPPEEQPKQGLGSAE